MEIATVTGFEIVFSHVREDEAELLKQDIEVPAATITITHDIVSTLLSAKFDEPKEWTQEDIAEIRRRIFAFIGTIIAERIPAAKVIDYFLLTE